MKKTEITFFVKRAQSRDEKAIEALYNHTYSDMYALVCNLCRNRNDVEDILQESYISAFSKLDTLAEKSSFVSWLKKIVINTWKDFLKNKAAIHETTLYDLTDEMCEDWQVTESSQELVELSETNREIRELVQALPENQRVCMVLFYYEEMRIEEIADVLGIPEGSVKSRLYYGRQKLRERMEQRGIHALGELPGGSSAAPAAEAAASQAVLGRILAALEIASDSGAAAAAGFGIGAKAALSVAALLTAGGLIGGIALFPHGRQSEPAAPDAVRTSVTTVATTAAATTSTTAATTTTTMTAAPTTTATSVPKRYVSFDYKKTDGGVVLTKYTGNEADVTIPETLDGQPVVAVGDSAFQRSHVLRSVSIPSTVRAVGSNAFRECRNLRSVSLGSGVNAIGDAAFLGCGLPSVTLPPNVREIESYAFAYCPSLTEVRAEEGVERISYAAFRDCPNLRTAVLPASVQVIGGDSFDGAAPDFCITAPEGTYAYEYESIRRAQE